jgi:ABC-type multidrug transport system ATPase subunit
VKETLQFAARLRLNDSASEKNARVLEILTQLNLLKVADTIIGDEEHRGISGGERKRVSIGKGIIHDPLLLFLDEPTSGLDSTNALLVINTLQVRL